MAKTLLSNPKFVIESEQKVTFDKQTSVNKLAENKALKITFKLPFRTPCPCCGSKMKKNEKLLWQCTKQENVFIKIEK